ncbi:uncharacterized protein LOC143489285 isoform X3 [Brachyhypopomus gauderio]|uniref:uncharacterized protein LOC143489259 isoform X3 n=1 Tax=Brachyhypopomus gauderio TaxID=698409 RepID=UPI004042272E
MKEMEALLKKTCDQLLEARKISENQVAKHKELMTVCQEEHETISKLQTALEQSIETASEYRAFVDGIKETLKKKDELLDQMQHEQHSLKEKVMELSSDLTKQDLVYRNTVSMLETERAATTRLTAENQALTWKLVEFQQITNEMSTKLQALETDLSIQTNTVVDLSEELQKAKALLRNGEEERSQQSSTISSLKLEVGELQQTLHTLSRGRKSNCAYMAVVTSSNEESRRIEAMERVLSSTRKEIQKACEELRQKQDAEKNERSRERELAELKAMCTALREKLQQCQNEQAQVEKAQRRQKDMEEKLAHKDLELNSKAQEVLGLQKQMCDDQDQIKTLSANLLQKEYNISYLQSEMRQGNTRIAVLQKEVQTLAEALWEHRTKRVDAEGERDRALSALWNQEQTIAQLKTEQVGSQQTLRKYWETCQLLQEKDKLIHELRFTLAEKERARVEQEKCLDALQKDIRSLTEKLDKLERGTRQSGTACGPDPAHPKGDNKRDTTGRCTVSPPNKPKKPAGKDQKTKQPQQDTSGRVQRNDSSVSTKTKDNRSSKTASPTPSTSAGHSQGVDVRKAGSGRSIKPAQKRKFTEDSVPSDNGKKLRHRTTSRVSVTSVKSKTSEDGSS